MPAGPVDGARPDLEALARVDPGACAAAQRFEAVVVEQASVLPPRVRALVRLAVDVSVSRLHRPGVERHVQDALQAGATPAEVVEVCLLAAVLGVHSMTLGYPILLEELAALGRRGELVRPVDERGLRLKERFVAARGSWSQRWDELLEGAPEYLAAYADFSCHPWEHGSLEPKLREFVYVAIDASANHLHASGVRAHIRNALVHGATAQEIVAVLALVSLAGLDSCGLGGAVLEAPRPSRGPA